MAVEYCLVVWLTMLWCAVTVVQGSREGILAACEQLLMTIVWFWLVNVVGNSTHLRDGAWL